MAAETCPFCGFKFWLRRTADAHEQEHTGEAPFLVLVGGEPQPWFSNINSHDARGNYRHVLPPTHHTQTTSTADVDEPTILSLKASIAAADAELAAAETMAKGSALNALWSRLWSRLWTPGSLDRHISELQQTRAKHREMLSEMATEHVQALEWVAYVSGYDWVAGLPAARPVHPLTNISFRHGPSLDERHTAQKLLDSAMCLGLDQVVAFVKSYHTTTATSDLFGSTMLESAIRMHQLEAVRLLLDRGARLNAPNLQTVQLLASCGADTTHINAAGATHRSVADETGDDTVVDWLDAVSGWPSLQIAVGCRLHEVARQALHRGLIDPAPCSLATLLAVAATSEHWAGSPAVCDATMTLAREAMAKWSPSLHQLYHARFRVGIRTVMLVAQRLNCGNHTLTAKHAQGRPRLPIELWLAVCSFLLRRHW